jgi:hypothetical protein
VERAVGAGAVLPQNAASSVRAMAFRTLPLFEVSATAVMLRFPSCEVKEYVE